MSTKTTFKRIALVTVAALGFGVMSTVAPASAAVAMDTLTVADGTGSVGDSVTATSATATLSFLPSAVSTDSMTVTASLVSGPAANTLFPVITLAETSNAIVDATGPVATAEVLGTKYNAYAEVGIAGYAAGTVSAKFNVYIGTQSANTGVVTAGTYVVRITPKGYPTAGTAAAKDITITIAAATQSSSLSTAHIARGVTAPTASTDLYNGLNASSAVKTAAADAIANIKVTQLKASGSAANESITATITGAGQLGCAGTQAGGAASGRALTCFTDGSGVSFINVFGDGTSGKATITLKGVTSGHSYATKTVLFSGTTIAKLVATAENPVVGAVGGSTTGAVGVTAFDADGNQIYNPTIYVISSAVGVLSNSYSTTGCTWDADYLATYCDVTPVAAGTANITFTNRASAAATTPTTRVDSNAVAIRVGSTSPASMSLSFDKTTYLPGEKATLTLKVLDAAGNAVAGSTENTTYANTFATGGVVSSYAFSSGDTTTATFVKLSTVTGLKTWTVYMPLVPTEAITVYAIPGTAFPAAYQAANALSTTTTVKATVSVGNAAGVDAATDAANEATDAANAATDAALAAADAADAATAAAQDASDAVAALSASVSKLISSLRAQITSLTNLVIKIQKKVRA
jgi:trimeric autotransporter adhesin